MNPNGTPLVELLRRAGAQDRAAFRAMYDQTSRRLFGVALGITRDRALASDALQEAFVQIWRNAARFDPERGGAEAWLAALVRYRALDLVRRGDAVAAAPQDEEIASPEALAQLEASADRAALRRCLDELDGERRRVVVLSFVHGFSHSELSARLGVPMGTVKSWIRRSLEALRLCLSA